MKYESSILKRLVDTYGVVGNPQYISEVIKEFIVRGKESFPSLFTYQSDWLAHIDEFGLKPSYTVSYTGQSIYAPNTLEKPIKSAILKGNTLVNIFDNWANNVGTLTPVKTQDGYFLFTGSNGYAKVNLDDIPTFKRGAEYTFIYRIKNSTYDGENNNTLRLEVGATTIYAHTVKNGIWKIKKSFSTDETNCFVKILSWVGSTGSAEVSLQIIKGDYTNVDIPYFEGMQSVKMPVLTTTGKNLFNGVIEFGGINSNTGLDTTWISNFRTSFMRVPKNNNDFIFTFNYKGLQMSGGYLVIIYYNENKERISSTSVANQQPFIFNQDAYYYRITQNIEDNLNISDITNIQLEKGTIATSYEPYKSNILTVNEEVELRGIGDVQDTLDCLTGEVTERISEVVLDGSENWSMNMPTTEYSKPTIRVSCNNLIKGGYNSGDKLISDKIPIGSGSYDYEYFGMTALYGEFLYIQIPRTMIGLELEENTSAVMSQKFKEWLTTFGPVKVQYPLATESIKTVDLTIKDHNSQSVGHLKSFNGGTHVYTSSLEGSLVPSVDISVVTDLEETMKMCTLDGNTL